MAENNFDTHGYPSAGRETARVTNVPMPDDEMVCDGLATAGRETARATAGREPTLAMGKQLPRERTTKSF